MIFRFIFLILFLLVKLLLILLLRSARKLKDIFPLIQDMGLDDTFAEFRNEYYMTIKKKKMAAIAMQWQPSLNFQK